MKEGKTERRDPQPCAFRPHTDWLTARTLPSRVFVFAWLLARVMGPCLLCLVRVFCFPLDTSVSPLSGGGLLKRVFSVRRVSVGPPVAAADVDRGRGHAAGVGAGHRNLAPAQQNAPPEPWNLGPRLVSTQLRSRF